MTSFVAMPIGSALAGPLAALLGVRPVIGVGAVVLAASSVVPLLEPTTRRLGHGSPEPVDAPVTA